MASGEIKYFSKALCKTMTATIILPREDLEGPFAVYYLLHGAADDHSGWLRQTGIERYSADYALMVVMPDGGRGFYCNAREGDAWETALVRDLIGYIDRVFHTIPNREGRCIGGLSMGGYGAIKLALRYPDSFCSANSHSGGVAFAHRPLLPDPNQPILAEYIRIVGEHPEGGPDDIFALAEGIAPSQRPALRLDCGQEDPLLGENRLLHAYLEALGYPHEYLEPPGQHEWGYWDVHVREALAFHARNLRLEKLESTGLDTAHKE
jgi:putative tributyrin esterase